MNRESYGAARIVASRVHAHFAHQQESNSGPRLEPLAQIPDAAIIEAIIDAAFWTSLRREEGFVPRISLAFVSPAESPGGLFFERPLALDPAALTRVAPAVERPGIHLAVCGNHEDLTVWGVTRKIPAFCFVLEVAAPGLLVIKHSSGEESGKYINVAVLEGDQIKVVDERSSSAGDCPGLLTSLLGYGSPSSRAPSVNIMVELAVSMRAHGRGGILLVVPAGTDAWRESILMPMPYLVAPPYSKLTRLSGDMPDDAEDRVVWREALDRAVNAVAGLTAVDGAVIITDQYEVLGFGAKIGRRKGSPRIEQVLVTEPIEGGAAELVHPDRLGNTRHLSAAQFVHDQRDAAALVASQDGRFTFFQWSDCESMVHAHRLETLLL